MHRKYLHDSGFSDKIPPVRHNSISPDNVITKKIQDNRISITIDLKRFDNPKSVTSGRIECVINLIRYCINMVRYATRISQ